MAYVPLALVALIGVLLTWFAFNVVTGGERQRVEQAFRAAALDRVLMVQREIIQSLGVVQDIGSFFDASEWVGRRDFREFVGPALKRYTSIAALQWIPRVTATERSSFEENARRSFPKFRINEINQAGDLVAAQHRPLYFPVLYVQPYQSNKEILGLDLAADPAILDALLQTRDAVKMRASPRIALEQDSRIEYGFAARLPVFDKADSDEAEAEGEEESLDTLENRQLKLRGFAAGVFRIGEIVESALQNLSPSGIDMDIYDVTDENERQFLYRHSSRYRPADSGQRNPGIGKSGVNKELTQTIRVTDRQWEVVCTSIPGRFQPAPWSGWATLAAGLPFTTLLTIYLSTLIGHTAKVERLVARRTTQLVEVNAELNSEIKERLHAEKELQKLNETLEHRVSIRTAEAERHVKELEQFAYVTSHDLKAPLRGIANLASWLEEDLREKLNEATREQLGLLRDRVQRMNALIEGLLEYSRIGKAAHNLESVDTSELLAEVIDSLSPPDGFVVDVAANMPTLYTDRLHLYQVFSNLIGNSIKHCKDMRGHAEVAVHNRGEYYEFEISDDGPGIAPEYHDKIFMMFQTLEAKDYGNNTGIGLALVKKIVQEHGGSITLDSTEGRGATFRFSRPARG
jgi:signal transduction histidine kinase